jgi:hypothetical protein
MMKVHGLRRGGRNDINLCTKNVLLSSNQIPRPVVVFVDECYAIEEAGTAFPMLIFIEKGCFGRGSDYERY